MSCTYWFVVLNCVKIGWTSSERCKLSSQVLCSQQSKDDLTEGFVGIEMVTTSWEPFNEKLTFYKAECG